MSVVAIRLHHLAARLPEPIGNALMVFDRRETLVVEVVGDDGLSGWGETWAEPAAAAVVIATKLAPQVLGQDPAHTGRLWLAMCGAGHADRQGIARMAVAALDMALHDLAARRRGVPLSTVLGGALRDRIPTYASGPFFKPGGHPYRDFAREIDGYLATGFRAIKIRSGFALADDVATALAVRRQIGPDRTLMLDFNQSYPPRAALEAALRMEGADLLWIEEPAQPADVAGYALLAGRVRPALAGGETFGHAGQFLPFLAEGCLDVLQPDIALCGGLTGVLRVVALAELHHRPVVPHVWGSTINFHAALHLAATLPAHRCGAALPFPYLEYDVGPNPLLDLAGRPVVNADGTVSVPTGPGLGIEITPAMLAPYLAHFQEIVPG
ncbi:mandelate racemase/muconate lactonizing enzyme family protein [Siculibacillus lacustris]|uniref:Mandelate racemase/muconate lactonizing enzyme family protein n=1 Tax=Siculibacillus lacustris TaxID=1549641 RepID=A0A4Q9VTN2_9HYPH|nr:mandelate racemase/muconate lactonizing enzyme family protein [Siculibacillus lacustris]TBW39451.1 mandelate racemase/muconate lactonizing enzyme family protein [Siculibacillus lacustris]